MATVKPTNQQEAYGGQKGLIESIRSNGAGTGDVYVEVLR